MYQRLECLTVMLSVLLGTTQGSVPNCSCGALATYNIRYRFGCECFRKQPLTNQSVFPASSLPVNLTSLFLGVPEKARLWFGSFSACETEAKLYSYLSADTMRIWEGTDLQFISFNNFDFEEGRAKQISLWLDNVKTIVTEMEIICGRMITLSAGVFVGFPKLTKLTITGTSLDHFYPGAFSELNIGSEPVLNFLDLSANRLGWFDWTVLQPVAPSLQSIVLKTNRMDSMQASVFSFPELQRVDLSENSLLTIPDNVIHSWPQTNSLMVNLDENPLCLSDSLCRCCSLQPLFQFVNRTNAWVLMDCGNLNSNRYLNETTLPTMDMTSFCTNRYLTHIAVGDYLEIGNTSFFDRCSKNDGPDAMACTNLTVATSAASTVKVRGLWNRKFLINALLLLALRNIALL